MPLIIPSEGEIELCDKMLKDALSVDEGYSLRLYTAVSPALGPNTTLANFTEATFTGYSAKSLTRAGASAATTVSGAAQITWAQQSWTNGGASPQTILGYYMVAVTSGKVLWCEAFGTSRVLNQNDVLQLTPLFDLASQA